MSYELSGTSLDRLEGVHVDLVAVVKAAIEITAVDFQVFEGVRTVERQRILVATGASRTMNSRHITGHAVDLVPFVQGLGLRWDWPLCFKVGAAVRDAAVKLQVPVTWGGVWDRGLNSLVGDLEDDMADYATRVRASGLKPFLDGPHFELNREVYA